MPIRLDGDNATATPGITGGDADTGLVFGTDQIEAVTGGTTRFTVESNGNVTIENGNLVFASGSGIDFSATGDGNANATSELLDDYEQGTWTPNVTFGGNNVGIAYVIRVGWYVKIGSLVTAMAGIQMSNNGTSSGQAKYEGLPYNVANLLAGTGLEGGGYAYYQDDVDGTMVGMLNMDVLEGTDGGTFRRFTTTSNPDTADTDEGNWTGLTNIRFMLQYRTA